MVQPLQDERPIIKSERISIEDSKALVKSIYENYEKEFKTGFIRIISAKISEGIDEAMQFFVRAIHNDPYIINENKVKERKGKHNPMSDLNPNNMNVLHLIRKKLLSAAVPLRKISAYFYEFLVAYKLNASIYEYTAKY